MKRPLAVKLAGARQRELQAETENVSAGGVLFRADSEIHEGSELEFTFTLPPEITLTENITVRCHARVIRMQKIADEDQVSVAAVIDRYYFAQ